MRGADEQQSQIFSYLSPEARVRKDHQLRAQMLYSIRSERLLMEEMDYNLLFRWFVGLNADDAVWDATVFTKNRDRLLQADVAKRFLAQVVEQARGRGLTSDEHFTVDGTLLEAWAGAKSFLRTIKLEERRKCASGSDLIDGAQAGGSALVRCTVKISVRP
jgi:hypothetical protein